MKITAKGHLVELIHKRGIKMSAQTTSITGKDESGAEGSGRRRLAQVLISVFKRGSEAKLAKETFCSFT